MLYVETVSDTLLICYMLRQYQTEQSDLIQWFLFVISLSAISMKREMGWITPILNQLVDHQINPRSSNQPYTKNWLVIGKSTSILSFFAFYEDALGASACWINNIGVEIWPLFNIVFFLLNASCLNLFSYIDQNWLWNVLI